MSNEQTLNQRVTAGTWFYSIEKKQLFSVSDGASVKDALSRACLTTRCALQRLNEIDPLQLVPMEDYLSIKYLLEMSDALLFAMHEVLIGQQTSA